MGEFIKSVAKDTFCLSAMLLNANRSFFMRPCTVDMNRHDGLNSVGWCVVECLKQSKYHRPQDPYRESIGDARLPKKQFDNSHAVLDRQGGKEVTAMYHNAPLRLCT